MNSNEVSSDYSEHEYKQIEQSAKEMGISIEEFQKLATKTVISDMKDVANEKLKVKPLLYVVK